ncbi:hypothetical protein RUND412_007614 [Rhizina undulata]
MSPFLQFAAFVALLSACFEIPSARCFPINLSLTLVAVFVVLFGFFTDFEVESLTTRLEEKKRKVEDLELTIRQQATNHRIDISTSKDVDDMKRLAMEHYIKKLENILSAEISNNEKLKAENAAKTTRYEDDIDLLLEQDELKKEVESLTTRLEEEKQEVEDLELTVKQQTTNHEIEIRASTYENKRLALERYIDKLQGMISEEKSKNEQLEAEHATQTAQYEDEIDVLLEQYELQKTYIRELQSTAFQLRKERFRARILIAYFSHD